MNVAIQDAAIGASSLDRLLRPRSVAIVGASEKPGALGASVLGNLERNGFSGEIHLINPKRAEIGGRACIPSVSALPEHVDVAVLAIPRVVVLETIKALAERKVGAAIIFSAGFAEGGEEGLAEQREIARVASTAGMIIEGPNCLGMTNFIDRIPLTFVETNAVPLGNRKGIGIVSQSGAIACVICTTLASRDLGLSFSISTGNEAASGVEDYVEFLIDDPATNVIAMVVESFRSPRRFLEAARRARSMGKTIVLLHPGRSSAARESAATHTGAMAGDYEVMRVKVERAGVILVETLEELGDVAELALRCPPVQTAGTAIMGESGAFKALALDLAEALELELPSIDDVSAPRLRAILPEFVGVSNPLDMTAQGLTDPELYYNTLAALAQDDRFGSVIVGIIQTDPVTTAVKFPPLIRAMSEIRPEKPIVFAGLDEGAGVAHHYIDEFRRLGAVYFPSTERALRAVARLNGSAARDLRSEVVPLDVRPELPAQGGVIAEFKAKALLAPLGIAFPDSKFCTSLEDALSSAKYIGFPVVLKAQSAELSHKSDAGGVILNIVDEASLKEGWHRLHDNIARHRPGLVLDGVLVEKMGERGVELIIGAKNDLDWGPVILVGFGGVAAEVLQDVRLFTPDLPFDGVMRELNRLKQAPLLHGFRGSPPLDVAATAKLVIALGQLLLAETSIREIDLNPVIVKPDGQGAVALDALMLVDATPPSGECDGGLDDRGP